MPPTIAIVGRPNVGKSTLFNRLTAKRTALVSDMPGLTRDRREGEAEIAGHKVTMIDTAGLEEAAPGSDRRAHARPERGGDRASRPGAVPARCARRRGAGGRGVRARRARSRAARSCWSPTSARDAAGAEGFYEAFQLGLGEPIAISAEHGEGIGELSASILAALGLKPKSMRRDEDGDDDAVVAPTEPPRPTRVAIVGRPNSGKSTLVNALLGEERMITGPEPGLTRDAVATEFEWGGRPVRLFDTAGLRRKARISERAEKLAASDAVRAIRFRRGRRAADRCRASLRAPGPHHRRSGRR